MSAAKATLIASVCLVVAAGCSSDEDGSDNDSDGESNSGGGGSTKTTACVDAPKVVVNDIAQGFTDPTFELHDSQMVPVQADEQNTAGYPKRMVAGNITGSEGAEPSAVGVWAINTAKSTGPIFALNPGAQELSVWGAAIQDGSPMAENRDFMAGSDSAAAAEECLS